MTDLSTLRKPLGQAKPWTRKTPLEPCRNCGDATPGNYCRNCGQRKVEVRISMRRMLMEALEDQFSINAALPRTLGALFARPGHLTREYVNGRIARYIPPFRLYLVSSLVFFVVLSMVPEVRAPLRVMREERGEDGRVLRADTLQATTDGEALPPAETGGWLDDVQVNIWNNQAEAMIRERLQRLNRMPPEEAIAQLSSEFLEHVPQMMFAMLPVFAAILALLYARRKRYYVEHFVFALHLHSFVFLAFTVMLLVRHPVLNAVINVWLLVYVFWALKTVYGQGWIKTATKYLALGFAYVVLMSLASVGLLIVTIMLI